RSKLRFSGIAYVYRTPTSGDRRKRNSLGRIVGHARGRPTTAWPAAPPGPLDSLHFNRAVSRLLHGFEAPSADVASCGQPGEVTLPLHPRTGKPVGQWDPSSPVRFVMHGKPRFAAPIAVRCMPSLDCGQPTASCKRSAPGLPAELVLTVPPAADAKGNGSDLDVGWSGSYHNFPVAGGPSLRACLTGGDGKGAVDWSGGGTAAAGGDPQPLNGSTFGAMLPLLGANVPVCVVNRFRDGTLTGTYNLRPALPAPRSIRTSSDS